MSRQILSQKHSGFSVWAGPLVNPDDSDTRHFLARYIDRGPIVLDKISIEHYIITYETKVYLLDPLVCPKCGEQMKIVEASTWLRR